MKTLEKPSIVRTATVDGLYLHGYYVPSTGKGPAVLHIHGFEGNFYENHFVQVLAERLGDAGVAFLSANTRGSGRDTDFRTPNGKTVRMGARYELFEEAILDIDAWIGFLLDRGYGSVCLQGHSLGTSKAVRYALEGERRTAVDRLILLAPWDRAAMVKELGEGLFDDLRKEARVRVGKGRGHELIEAVGLSYRSFLSWSGDDEYGRMFDFSSRGYDFPALRRIGVPVKVIAGSNDSVFHPSDPDHPEAAMSILVTHIRGAEGRIIEGAPHSFHGYEEDLAAEVLEFVTRGRSCRASGA